MGFQIALPTSGPSDERRYLDILDGNETWLQRRLAGRGLAKYEPETMATLLALMQTGPANGVFLDVGAHVGFYASVLERLSNGRLSAVHAFEPTPTTFDIGCRIREVNQLSFEYHRLAMSSTAGEATLYLSSTAEVTNSLIAGFRRARGTLSVKTLPMDEFVEQHDLVPSLIKIDVECHEVPVLEGCLRTIERHRPQLVVEVLERHHEGFLATPVWQRLREAGYTFYHINPAVPWRAARRNTVFPRSRDLLLTPKALDGEFWQEYMAWKYGIFQCTARLNRAAT